MKSHVTVLVCRSVCKTWSHLTRINAFIHQHLSNFGENETDHGFINMRSNFYEYTSEYRSKRHSRSVKFDEKSPEWFYISNSCHCLVCVYNQDISIVTILIINPAIDDYFVELPDVGITNRKVLNVCLCHDDQANKYKVVRFYCSSDGKGTGIEVLTLGDSTSRQVGEVPTGFRGSTPQCLGGVMHWMTYKDKYSFSKLQRRLSASSNVQSGIIMMII
ncbi:F-box protein interaction domain protein [Rhynchospora pubera]|uniref:F-box protein interaction domain protein n=1 Tax=Rhynchospora pubera TaxID=906938 RepID=A0AAV8DA72_9POAL|nr:F-box protein interaction domain protein [Rhynchospora pubera]